MNEYLVILIVCAIFQSIFTVVQIVFLTLFIKKVSSEKSKMLNEVTELKSEIDGLHVIYKDELKEMISQNRQLFMDLKKVVSG